MKRIERLLYFSRLVDLIGTPDIKVLTGMRRSGKSELLKSVMSYVRNNVEDNNTIFIDFFDLNYDNIKTYKQLFNYVEKQYLPNKRNFLFLDEVQLCKKFELAVNSFHNSQKYDIYITGSNGELLGGDLATLFTGRYIELHVFPFSLQEFCKYYELQPSERALERYVKEGGLAGSYLYEDELNRKNYIDNVYKTILTKDLVKRYRLTDENVVGRVAEFLMDNIGNLTSPNTISNVMNENRNVTNHVTINRYIKILCDAYMFYAFKRYDIKGKRYLKTEAKYYVNDVGMRYTELGNKDLDYGRIYENIVAIELLRRGYKVFVGKLYQKEIDFVAERGNEKIFIQVSDNISDEKTFQREYAPLAAIKNNYKKMIIARTFHDEYQYEGIRIVNLLDWLTDGAE